MQSLAFIIVMMTAMFIYFGFLLLAISLVITHYDEFWDLKKCWPQSPAPKYCSPYEKEPIEGTLLGRPSSSQDGLGFKV